VSRFIPDSASQNVGVLGAALLAISGLTLVSARWSDVGPGGRLTLLLVLTALVGAAAVAVRDLAPRTASTLSGLVVVMIPLDAAGIALAAGGDWRSAATVGGPVAVVLGELVYRGRRRRAGDWLAAAGLVATASGVAATHDLAGPVVLAVAALIAAVCLERDRDLAAVAAVIAGLAPAFRVLRDATFMGQGTLRDVGLIDRASVEETVLAGGLATAALLVVSTRRRSARVLVAASATAVAAAIDVWAELRPPASTGVIAAATLLALYQLVRLHPICRGPYVFVADDLFVVATGVMTGLAARWAWLALLDWEGLDRRAWSLTAAVLCGAWLALGLRSALGGAEPRSFVEASYAVVPGAALAAWASAALWSGEPLLGGLLVAGGALALRFSAHAQAPLLSGVAWLAVLLLVGGWNLPGALAAAALMVAWALPLGVTHRRVELWLAWSFGALSWWAIVDALGEQSMDLLLLPVLVLAARAAVSLGVAPALASGSLLVGAGALAVASRADDGRPVHLLVFVGLATVLALAAALSSEGSSVTIAGSCAVGGAVYEALAVTVGLGAWAWFAVLGCSALAAAAMMEATSTTGDRTVSSAA